VLGIGWATVLSCSPDAGERSYFDDEAIRLEPTENPSHRKCYRCARNNPSPM